MRSTFTPLFSLATLLVFSSIGPAVGTTSALCNLPVQFSPGTSLVTGWNPHYIVTGDFNSDGRTDLAVAASFVVQTAGTGSGIVILLGNGNGTFGAPVSYAAGTAPFGLAAGDFNHDGITDLASSNISSNNVSILLGNGAGGIGNGTFAAPVSYPAGAGPFHVVAKDIDLDGILDLVVSNNGAPTLNVLRGLGSGGNGNGTFAAAQSYPLIAAAADVKLGDFDHDGLADIAICLPYGGKVGLLRNLGGGVFAPPVYLSAGVEPFGLAIADWDSDGILDMIVANGSSGGLQWMRGLGSGGIGNGSFAAPVLLGGGNCAAAAAADINGDGRLDLLSAPTSSSIATPVQLYLGNGNGTFAPPISYPVGIIPLNLAVGDFDGSGKPDIAVANYFNDFISVLLGTCLADPNAPALTAVRDAPNDQGGKVFVTWTRSALDVTGGSIQSYRVWRRIPAVAATALMRQGGSAAASIRAIPNTESGASSTSVTYWEAAATLPAQRLPGYGYTSSTSQDSLPGGNPYTAFFVTAATNNIDLFYDSAVDSGYSVDNLPPSPPLYLAAALVSNGASLHWRPNVEPDLAGYALYRGNSGDFVPSIGNQIALLSDSLYHDPNGGPGSYYKLAALDAHGNASSYTAASLDFPTALLATALAPHVSGEQVDLTWSLLGSLDRPMSVQRSSGGDVWQQLGSVVPDGEGFVRFSDRDIRPAAVYHYRLAVAAAGGDIFAGNVEVRIPAFELALAGVRPNPLVSGAFAVRFTLGNETHAVLNVVDISGRRIASVEVGSLGPGPHTVDIDRVQRVPAGLYVIRLTNGNRTLSSKAAVMR